MVWSRRAREPLLLLESSFEQQIQITAISILAPLLAKRAVSPEDADGGESLFIQIKKEQLSLSLTISPFGSLAFNLISLLLPLALSLSHLDRSPERSWQQSNGKRPIEQPTG